MLQKSSTSTCVSYYFINFPFRSFFSLFSICKTNLDFFSPSSFSSSSETHKHTHTDKPTQRRTKTHGPFNACGSVLQQRLMLVGGRDPLKQNAEPTISHYLIEPARATPPKHRSHHPPNTVQPSPPNHHHHQNSLKQRKPKIHRKLTQN